MAGGSAAGSDGSKGGSSSGDKNSEHGSIGGNDSRLRSPIRLALSHHRRHQSHDDDDASIPPSPLMSPYSLGMSPLSPLRHQFSPSMTRSTPSYPRSDSYPSDHENEGIIHDSQDVLVQRLNDLAARLSRRTTVEDNIVGSLHTQVDEMENVLNIPGYPLASKKNRGMQISPRRDVDVDESSAPWNLPHVIDMSNPSSPSQASPSEAKAVVDVAPSPAMPAPPPDAPKISAAEAERVVVEAQRLQKGLETVIGSLRARQQESEQLQEALRTQVEEATQRNSDFQEQIQELKMERREGEMEMLNLRIQLKAIEVQCLSYLPEDVDQELSASIDAWREEWSTFKRKRARKKEQLFGGRGVSENPTNR